MRENWKPPDPLNVRRAVEVAIADLEVIEREVAREESQRTHSRLLRAEYWGIRAATRKRLAEVEFLFGGDWRRTLRAALRDYQKGMGQGVQVDHWVLGQYVVLRCVLDQFGAQADRFGSRSSGDDRRLVHRWWDEAYRSVVGAAEAGDPQDQMWAHSSMADLVMVAQAMPDVTDRPFMGDVTDALDRMIKAVGGPDECTAIWPTFRQFWRWKSWWTPAPWSAAAEAGYSFLLEFVEPEFKQAPPRGTST